MTTGTTPAAPRPSRRHIYYWKCDRPAAFHGTQADRESSRVEPALLNRLEQLFPGQQIQLRDGGGQGNHLTWIAKVEEHDFFVRVENGPEQDDHLEVETHVMKCVSACGVPTPRVYYVDASRTETSFALQIMDCIPHKDLNDVFKQGNLDPVFIASEIGAAVARWQSVPVQRFGHFDPQVLRSSGELRGFHATYRDYFHLNLQRHLSFLHGHDFLSGAEAQAISSVIKEADGLLELTSGCLVHKDLAFWNMLGTAERVTAYIDWDDAIAGDELDDLSLLGCFHDGSVIGSALEGYISLRQLPMESSGRFWLHLLRNMIVKSVIRVGAGYFDRNDSFFLLGNGITGAEFVKQTRSRLFRALEGLRSNDSPSDL